MTVGTFFKAVASYLVTDLEIAAFTGDHYTIRSIFHYRRAYLTTYTLYKSLCNAMEQKDIVTFRFLLNSMTPLQRSQVFEEYETDLTFISACYGLFAPFRMAILSNAGHSLSANALKITLESILAYQHCFAAQHLLVEAGNEIPTEDRVTVLSQACKKYFEGKLEFHEKLVKMLLVSLEGELSDSILREALGAQGSAVFLPAPRHLLYRSSSQLTLSDSENYPEVMLSAVSREIPNLR